MRRPLLASLCFALVVALGVVAVPGVGYGASSVDVSASFTVTGTTVAFCTPTPTPQFSEVAKASGSTIYQATTPLDVCNDESGGWNISASMTPFTNGSATVDNATVSVDSTPSDTCDAHSNCITADNLVSYPYVMPIGIPLPPVTRLFDAAAGSGTGSQTVTPTWTLTVPGGVPPGYYLSDWTITLVSGP